MSLADGPGATSPAEIEPWLRSLEARLLVVQRALAPADPPKPLRGHGGMTLVDALVECDRQQRDDLHALRLLLGALREDVNVLEARIADIAARGGR